MANWRYTINIQPEWSQAQDDQLSIRSLIYVIKERFESSNLPQDLRDDFEDFMDSLEQLVEESDEDGDVDADEFDAVWNDVYNWADRNRIWINTLSAPAREAEVITRQATSENAAAIAQDLEEGS
jgi:hypothetical protein